MVFASCCFSNACKCWKKVWCGLDYIRHRKFYIRHSFSYILCVFCGVARNVSKHSNRRFKRLAAVRFFKPADDAERRSCNIYCISNGVKTKRFCGADMTKKKLCTEKNVPLKKKRLVDVFLHESYQEIKVFITFAVDYKAANVNERIYKW